ncbi:MAG: VWA domain-containing protein [Pseudomonadales bacterium]|nr:VWA domain-containing protein [Pseudomonadales bacterium]
MEEWVGKIWHRLVTRLSMREFPDAEVRLETVQPILAVFFRALGGESGLRIMPANESNHGARRRVADYISGENQKVELAWYDHETLRLPSAIAVFESKDLNRELFIWLAALAVYHRADNKSWIGSNSVAAEKVLKDYPGFRSVYCRLVEAHLAQRPDPESLKPAEAATERVIQKALRFPGSQHEDVLTVRSPRPVVLWLHPEPPLSKVVLSQSDPDEQTRAGTENEEFETEKRKSAERVDHNATRGGLLAFRLESLFSRAEFVPVDRPSEEDLDDASSAANDMDVISLSRDRRGAAKRVRFDLDLPAEAFDDQQLGEGIPLPEWNYRQGREYADFCRLQLMTARNAVPQAVPDHLKRDVRLVRAMFESVRPCRHWLPAQPDGCEVDINALIQHVVDRKLGHCPLDANLFRDFRETERDLSCLLLADVSLSTDAHVNNEQRVLDVIKDSLYLFSEALSVTGDQFAVYGFSSLRRNNVRFHQIKEFSEPLSDSVRGRIAALSPGYYTRMGAAIRYATQLLEARPARQKLLLILTDGKPNDLDLYEGRYGIEDTRVAATNARKRGLRTFCVTVDRKGADYLPSLFGSNSYLQVRNASELPRKLPGLYAQLTAR